MIKTVTVQQKTRHQKKNQKGLQMVQEPNKETNSVRGEPQRSAKEVTNDQLKKTVHWTRVQCQGHQMCLVAQAEMKENTMSKKFAQTRMKKNHFQQTQCMSCC